jgi:hypothetical protein
MTASTALYVLADEYLAAAHQLADLELDPQTVADTLGGLSGDLEVKATNVAMFARNLEAAAEAIKGAEAQMAARRKAIENRAAGIREYLKVQMERTGIKEIASPYFKLAIRSNPPAVVIDAASQIPAEYMRQPEPPPPAPDKKAIAAAIKAGKEIAGAHLEQSTRLEIK